MYLHQNAFSPRPANELDSVALRALSLMVNHDGTDARLTGVDITECAPQCIEELTHWLYDASLSTDRNDILSAINEMQCAGTRLLDYTSILVPKVAQRLGQDWVDDTISFAEVTIGCARLQASVHHFESRLSQNPLRRSQKQRCLVVVPKGAQHTLGAVVLATQLRHSGCQVDLVLDITDDKMKNVVNAKQYDALLISASLGQDEPALRKLVRASRSGSVSLSVIIGGTFIEERSDVLAGLGADHLTSDWQAALNFCMDGLPSRAVVR